MQVFVCMSAGVCMGECRCLCVWMQVFECMSAGVCVYGCMCSGAPECMWGLEDKLGFQSLLSIVLGQDVHYCTCQVSQRFYYLSIPTCHASTGITCVCC